jgi:outer membrane usher protein FimD/PapC
LWCTCLQRSSGSSPSSRGDFVPPGSTGHTVSGEDFVVGYDGEAYIKNLERSNVVVELANGSRRASFDFQATAGEQTRIGPLACQPDRGERSAAVDLLAFRK